MIGVFGFLSEYSLQQSAYRLDDLLTDAKANNYPFVAVNDVNNLYGAYKLFKSAKLPVIIGMKLDIVHLGKDTSILCYALNDKGYKNLIILSTKVQFNKDNKLDFLELIENQEGLLFISSGYLSDIDSNINNEEEVKERLNSYKRNLTHFYLGLSLQSMNQEIHIAPKLKRLSNELNIRLLPLNYITYKKGDHITYDAVIKISDNTNIRVDNMDLSFLTLSEIKTRYLDYPEVFNNLKNIYSLFKYQYKPKTFELPQLPKFKDSKRSLYELSVRGLNKKVTTTNKKDYLDRLNYELDVINELGFNNYFLIVYDFVKYAKDKNILVGPGRGSAAGSLVSYALDITNVDPLKHGLLFERFLNKERASMPDIDLDFPDDRREEVIDYIKDTYGRYHVLSINTFSRFSTKAAVRDVCRIKGLNPSETNRMAKIISSAVRLDKEASQILELANKFDGLPRQTGTHAAGVVLGKEDLRYIIPLQPGPKLFQSQFDHDDLTDMGLLKIDLLGIRNLSVIMRVIELIKKHRNVVIDLDKIPFDDKKTYELLQQGDTLGIFQLESGGMRGVLRKLSPTNFNDLVALLALYRPGPLQNIDLYIDRRNGESFDYIDPALEPILKETYGIIIYQEQIMKIAQNFAGYTLNEADLLRVGISKKDKDILVKEKEHFISSSIKNGRTTEQAELIYDYIVRFADYGFNKSHSVAYGVVAYQMAYLKANYYDIFMSVYLSMMGNDSNIKSIINILNQKNINVLPPSINYSTDEFVVTKEGLLYPLTGIRNIGTKTAKDIVEERSLNGLYKSFDQFKTRTEGLLSDRIMDGLIFSGALDIFGKTKKTLFSGKEHSTSLYETLLVDVKDVEVKEYDNAHLATKEREALGFNLAITPNTKLDELVNKYKLIPLNEIVGKKSVKTVGVIQRINEITTKKGDLMAFVTFTDEIMYVDVAIFSTIYKDIKDELKEEGTYLIELQYQDYQGGSWHLIKIRKV